jgi:hypothetical protein
VGLGNINIEVLYAHEDIWLPQKRIAELFDCTPDRDNIGLDYVFPLAGGKMIVME